MADTIGALRVTLGLDSRAWDNGIGGASAGLRQLQGQVQELGRTVAKLGVAMSVGITAPLALTARSATGAAGSIESAMKRVEAALDGVSPATLADLEASAKRLGPAMGRGAIEAASAIEMLAKNGLDASDILGGALQSSLRLATAGNAELAPAADLTTDVMQQFGKTARDLPRVVDQVTGAMNASKFGFEDFQQAVGQAGGVSGGLGVEFSEFATAIAATSASFSSGSDAGTSFKTFLTSLNPTSKEAADMMKALGIEFYDAQGRMKDLADVAEILKQKVGGLNEQAQNEALKTMFGQDALRTALELMRKGKDGFIDLQNTINRASADAQVSKMTEGLEASANRRAAAFEGLRIAIGNAGLKQAMTALNDALAGIANRFAQLEPIFLKIGVAIGAVVAAVGPLIAVLGTVGSVVLPLVLARLGPFAIALGLLINPMGTLIALVGRFVGVMLTMRAITMVVGWFASLAASLVSVTSLMGALRVAMMFLGGPWGVAILGISAAFYALSGKVSVATKASSDLREATDKLHQVLGDSSATDSAIAQSRALVEQRVKEAAAARKATEAELQLQLAKAEKLRGIGTGGRAANFGLGSLSQNADADVTRLRGELRTLQLDEQTARMALFDAKLPGNLRSRLYPTTPVGGGGAGLPDLDEGKKAKKQASTISSTLDELLPIRAATLKLAEQQKDLNAALKAGTIDAGQYAAAMFNADEALKSVIVGGERLGPTLEGADQPLVDLGEITQRTLGDIAVMTGAVADSFAAATRWADDLAQRINEDLTQGLYGMIRGFNSLGDVAVRVIEDIGEALLSRLSPSGGSGIGGLIADALSGAFSKTSSASDGGTGFADFGRGVRGFKTGGTFEVGGAGGADSQLMQFYATPGEMVRITKGENDNQRAAGVTINQTIQVQGGVDLATRTEVARLAAATRQSAIDGIREEQRRRG